jgi:hypothetical protein
VWASSTQPLRQVQFQTGSVRVRNLSNGSGGGQERNIIFVEQQQVKNLGMLMIMDENGGCVLRVPYIGRGRVARLHLPFMYGVRTVPVNCRGEDQVRHVMAK